MFIKEWYVLWCDFTDILHDISFPKVFNYPNMKKAVEESQGHLIEKVLLISRHTMTESTDNTECYGPFEEPYAWNKIWVSSGAEQKGLRKYQPGFFHEENWLTFHPALRKRTVGHRHSVHHMCEVKIKGFDRLDWMWTWCIWLPIMV